jgi:hypothetical protein
VIILTLAHVGKWTLVTSDSTTLKAVTHISHRPYFFRDYDISEEQVRDLVRSGSPTEKAWVVGRILEHATWSDIWRSLTVANIRDSLPHIRFRRLQDRDPWIRLHPRPWP